MSSIVGNKRKKFSLKDDTDSMASHGYVIFGASIAKKPPVYDEQDIK